MKLSFALLLIIFGVGTLKSAICSDSLEWCIELTLEHENGTLLLELGMTEGQLTSAGYDEGYDKMIPPPGMDYFAGFYIENIPYYLSTDIREMTQFVKALCWKIIIRNAHRKQTIINWHSEKLDGEHDFCITFDSDSINMRTTDSVKVIGNKEITIHYIPHCLIQYDFEQTGWHLISLPIKPDNSDVRKLFPSALDGIAYSWDAFNQKYDANVSLEPIKGYWIYITESISETVTGIPLSGDTLHFHTGWHLLGGISSHVTNFKNPMDEPDCSICPYTYQWNPVIGPYLLSSILEPKKGSWIRVLNECDLVLPGETVEGFFSLLPVEDDQRTDMDQFPPLPPFMSKVNKSQSATPVKVSQNYPNPFNNKTSIEYTIPSAGWVTITVFNIRGEKINMIEKAHQSPGTFTFHWDGLDDYGVKVPSGIYLIKICVKDYIVINKVIMTK